VVLVLVVPTLAHVAINRAVPVDQGAEIALARARKSMAPGKSPAEM
jgi:hypothetical protein